LAIWRYEITVFAAGVAYKVDHARARECMVPDPEAEFWREFGEESKPLIARK
jgi:hypothetical protein